MLEKTNKFLRETYYFTRLDGGLPVFFIPRQGFNKKIAVLATEYGSIDVEFILPGRQKFTRLPAGVPHFLEHQLFKKDYGDISDKFAANGANYNASTGYTNTAYFFTCTDNFRENFKLLIELVFAPYFEKTNVGRERSIIEQEIKMYDDMPETILSRNLMESLYRKHPARVDIGGTVQSIQKITPEILQQAYATFYHPGNMVLVIAGDIDFSLIRQDFNEYFSRPAVKSLFTSESSGKISDRVLIKRKKVTEPDEINEFSRIAKGPVARPQISIGYKERRVGLKGEAFIKQNMITGMMLDLLIGTGSPLYSQLYGEGLVDTNFSFFHAGYKTHGLTILNGETDDPEKLHDRILKGIRKAQRTGFKKMEVARIKRKGLGAATAAFDDFGNLAGLFTNSYFNRINAFDVIKYLKSISVKDINKRLRSHLDKKYHAISILKPR